MKNILIGTLATIAVALIATINVSINLDANNSVDVSLSNVEALAYELPETGITCSYPHCSSGRLCHRNTWDWRCYCDFTGNSSDTCIQ